MQQPVYLHDPVMDLFASTGAYLKGHFRLTSGLHSPEYLQCALVLSHPEHAGTLGKALAAEITKLTDAQTPGLRPELVVSPALGGVVIGHEVARALGTPFLFTEREGGKMTLRRGFQVPAGVRAVVVEDVITTGGSTREVVDLLQAAGAQVLAAGSIIDRSGGEAEVGTPRTALKTLHVTAYDPAQCPLCAAGEPVVKPGSRQVEPR